MIKTKKGELEISGTDTEIIADISIIIRNVYMALSKEQGETIAKLRLQRAFNRAFLSEEEIRKEAEKCKKINSIFDEIIEVIKGSEEND